jgi:2Fe-2S ferredoxin
MAVANVLQPDGQEVVVLVPIGSSVMRAAVDAGVDGIVGECGGAAMCGTCHVFVDEEWLDRLPPMLQNEDELLDCTAVAREWNSRLSCQLRMTAELDGLPLRLPDSQR